MNVDHRALRGALQLGLTVALATALASAQSISQHNLDTKQYSPVRHTVHTEKQRYDGWYNNLAHQDWGAVESQLVRKAPSSYADGVYMIAGEDRPSPRILSQALMKGEDGLPSMRNLTVLFVFFGQMISSEVLMASEPGCPIEFHRIKINRCDEMYDKKCRGEKFMPFHRAIYDSKTGQSPNNPREQINMGTSWIDGSFVYSTSETWVNTMRSFKNGTFRTTEGKLPPRNRERVPLFNSPPARYLGIMNPERMFSKCQICQIAETELLFTWCLSMAAINWWTVLTPAVAIGRMFNSR